MPVTSSLESRIPPKNINPQSRLGKGTAMARMMKKSKAFSLIEMAVIVIIVGVLLATFLPRMLDTIKTDVVKDSRNDVRYARDEIIGYAVINNVLPPATGNWEVPDPGTITNPPAIATLEDAWGQRLLYLWAQNGTGDLVTTPICDHAHTTLDVIQGGTATSDVAFIVLSTGENMQCDLQGFPGSGAPHPGAYTANIMPHGSDNATSGKFDDIVEYVTLSHLQDKLNCADGGGGPMAPPGADISFANDFSDFNNPSTSPARPNAVTLDTTEKTVGLGGGEANSYGCLWYQGNYNNGTDDICTSGECQFNDGVRLFFRFTFNDDDTGDADSTDYGHGFTFAVIDGGNAVSVCGNSGNDIGYAGSGSGGGIDPPKLGVEVDTYPDTLASQKNDSAENHVAHVFWGSPSRNDDNVHGEAVTNPDSNGTNPEDYREAGAAFPEGFNATVDNVAWLEDGVERTMRIDITRGWDATVSRFTINATAWVGLYGNSSDLTETYWNSGVPPNIHYNDFDYTDGTWPTIRFGWTQATGGGGVTQDITISDFGIKFLP
ncbi:MAG: type II secretion system protein [Thermodesulfobacteriota bacterium]|nr:type II secretion system protein [Thermodesulfobacteriota bacterium]